jgi:hypothetical protein
VDGDRAADRLGTVFEAEQAGAEGRVGAAHAVVLHGDLKDPASSLEDHPDERGTRMLAAFVSASETT